MANPAWQDTAARQAMKLLVWLYRRSRGVIGGKMHGAPVLLLTTTGRRTGRSWTTPLIFGRDGDRLVVIASNAGSDRHPAWWLNLRDTQHGIVRVGADTFKVHASEAESGERQRLWDKMSATYGGYEGYAAKTTRGLPVVVLDPI